MKISDILAFLESKAPSSLQESYDNAGLITGSPEWECTGILVSLDATEPVIREAMEKNCNLVVAHHPIVFGGLKKINGKNYVEKTVITAIKNDIAIYAVHTNLDNVIDGVNGRIAAMLGLQNTRVLAPKEHVLKKLYTFVPLAQAEAVRSAIFSVGAGHIGNYAECSFNAAGTGTFKGGENTTPFAGQPGLRHEEPELKMEIIFPAWLERDVVKALLQAHPYEEAAYDIISLANTHACTGSGLVGELPEPVSETEFLTRIRSVFKVPVLRHTRLTGQPVKRVALCGGAGSFLISKALAAGAQIYITGDLKYHEFFDANDRLVLADTGHYESEQFTIDLLAELLEQKFPTFAVLKTSVNTNPVRYFGEA